MKKIIIIAILSAFITVGFCQSSKNDSSLTLLFIGDIMGHDTQIASAYNPINKKYDYDPVFKKISPLIKNADFAIANLEVTLAGRPYKGYPQFSSPDQLAISCKKSGINVFVTANNHCCDRGKNGILRTIKILDSLKIPHTGTFSSSTDRKKNNLLILHKNGIKVGMLNYTYGTNGNPIPTPTVVNMINKESMLSDINSAKKMDIDKLIVFIHWGTEYKSHPSKFQKNIAAFLFKNGVNIIIGSHPHVIQRLEYDKNSDRFIAYSLGNFVSNQRKRRRDGGLMVKLKLTKDNDNITISDYGYYLTWVNKPTVNGKKLFEILPCHEYELNGFSGLNRSSQEAMKTFINDSRLLLNEENKAVKELFNY